MTIDPELAQRFTVIDGYYVQSSMIDHHTDTGIQLTDGRHITGKVQR